MAQDDQKPKAVLPNVGGAPQSSKDPLRFIVDVIKDKDIADEDKQKLIEYNRTRFYNRRRMAYTALYTLIGSFALIFLAAFVDGMTTTTKIVETLEGSSGLIGTVQGLLAAIVGAYYGVSAWRPSS